MYQQERNQNVPVEIFRTGRDLEQNEICFGLFFFF